MIALTFFANFTAAKDEKYFNIYNEISAIFICSKKIIIQYCITLHKRSTQSTDLSLAAYDRVQIQVAKCHAMPYRINLLNAPLTTQSCILALFIPVSYLIWNLWDFYTYSCNMIIKTWI